MYQSQNIAESSGTHAFRSQLAVEQEVRMFSQLLAFWEWDSTYL
jgi:hypothetical protein